jgi:preprotein translocase subunit SecG
MTIFVTVLHVLVCLILVGLVLLQKGKGAEIGAVFGGSSASTIFGSAGAGSFLTRLTTWAAVVFMVTSFYLAYVALNAEGGGRFAAPPTGIETPAASPGAADAPAGDFVEVQPAQPSAETSAGAEAAEPAPAPSAPTPAPSETPQ